jgi:hypothetical protein
MRRIKEVLETHEWTASATNDNDDLNNFLNSDEENDYDDGFNLEVNELEREMMGLRFAIQNGGGDGGEENEDDQYSELKVEELEALMLRMHAIKGMFSEFSIDVESNCHIRYECRSTRISTQAIRLQSYTRSYAGVVKQMAGNTTMYIIIMLVRRPSIYFGS